MRSANYVEETTTSIAGTSGDGAVTMTAITSTPRFSTVFGTQATTVRYIIEDTVNKKFETGVGSVASNVLTRTLPQITWDGTTYDDSTPAALQFGASPTSGNIKIRMGATSESSIPQQAGVNRSISGDANWRDYALTAHMLLWSGSGVAVTLTAGREYYAYYRLDRGGLLDGVQFEVTTGVAGNMKMALYSAGSAGLPSTKIVDFTTTSVTTTGIKTDTATGSWSPTGAVKLTPGEYYIGFITDVACAIRNTTNAANSAQSPTPLGRQGVYGYGSTAYATGSYASGLPSTPTISTLSAPNSVNFPWFGLRVTP